MTNRFIYCSDHLTEAYLSPTHHNMRAFKELDENIEQLENDIINACDRLTRAVEQRKQELLRQVQKIRDEKIHSLQLENENSSTTSSYIITASSFGRTDSSIGSCLRFVADEAPLSNFITEYGCIDEGRASAAKSTVHGIGVKYAIEDEPTQFELETRNNCDELSWVEQDQIDVMIKKENISYKCIVKNNCNGTYDILYELPESGHYEVHVKVNGRHLPESPYKCTVFEKKDVKFLDYKTEDEWTFQSGDKAALVERTDQQRTSKLYSNDPLPARAWKVRVTAACPKIKIKFGYSNNAQLIPDLHEEYFCKFDLHELIGYDHLAVQSHHHTHTTHHHHHRHNRRSKHKTAERKQSTYHRSSLNFVIFQDTNEKLIHVGVEGTAHEKTTSFKGDVHKLVPFIGIKHFCKNASCPRPMLVFS